MKKTTICYFGNYNPRFSRNAVYARGLRERGIEVIECVDRAPGIRKYINLFKKHWKIRHQYDALIVGYPGHIIVPFARLISRKPVIFDALCSFYESEILSRDAFKNMPFRHQYARFVDWLANTTAHFILLETKAQCAYYEKDLHVPSRKLVCVYTGVDDTQYFNDPSVKKRDTFTVLFRGRITPEAGVEQVLEAARILKDEDVDFEIIGFGWGEVAQSVMKKYEGSALPRVHMDTRHVPIEELRSTMLSCHVSLGQFADHSRLLRTIPHKAYESMAMGLPYVSVRMPPPEEVFEDGKTCVFVPPADPHALADAIMRLKRDSNLCQTLSKNLMTLYHQAFDAAHIVEPIIALLQSRAK